MIAAQAFPPAGPLRGSVRVPGDKSITQRALLIGALGAGPSVIEEPLYAGDTVATADMLRALGVALEWQPGDRRATVRGVGLRGLVAPPAPLDARNSGTGMRLLTGVLAGQEGLFVVDGDDSLRRRPMDRIVAPLRRMGVMIAARAGRYPPLLIEGGDVRAVTYDLPMASAQVKSCVLLAGLHAAGETTVVERVATRDHTERMLRAAGVAVVWGEGRVVVEGRPRLSLPRVRVPGDLSSAAFLIAAAALIPGSRLEIVDVGLNPTRLGFVDVLRRMGGDAVTEVTGEDGGEPRGRLIVRQAPLHGATVVAEEVPALIDELPLIALLAAFAEGETVVAEAGELRVKESDRLAGIGDLLGCLGGRVELSAEGFRVEGSGGLRGGVVASHGDHRLAMTGAVAGLASREGVTVEGFTAADVSFPAFADLVREVVA